MTSEPPHRSEDKAYGADVPAGHGDLHVADPPPPVLPDPLHEDLPSWAAEVLSVTASGVAGQTPFADDHAALKDMPNRPGARCCA